ncbi:MAG: hypothetical protein ACLT76_01435 [Clostridium fessum]
MEFCGKLNMQNENAGTGKALFRHYCVFLLENPVFGMDSFILLAEGKRSVINLTDFI